MNDLQELYNNSRFNALSDDPKIQEMLDRGYYVVVDNDEYLCPGLDSIKWVRKYLRHFSDRHSADEFAKFHQGEWITHVEVLTPSRPLFTQMPSKSLLKKSVKPSSLLDQSPGEPLPTLGSYDEWFALGKSDRLTFDAPRAKCKPYLEGWNS